MNISDIYSKKIIKYSIEVFPPKNGGTIDSILSTIENLNGFRPAFVSVTFGAMGHCRGGTIELATMIKRKYDLEAMAHITSVGKSKQDLENLLVGARYAGVENILALRGDPEPGKQFRRHKDGHRYAYQLVEQIKSMNEGKYLHGAGDKTNFSIGVACYPEGHKDNPKKNLEPLYLKAKQDAGAHFAITQMIFDNDKYLKFLDDAGKAGVSIPIIPGIMPLRSIESATYLQDTFGVSIPDALKHNLQRHRHSKEAMEDAGIDFAVGQCRELLEKGAKGVHIYTMNRPEIVKKMISKIQLDFYKEKNL